MQPLRTSRPPSVATRHAAPACRARRTGLRTVCAAIQSDHSTRVQGDAKKVSLWLADVGNWPAWHPGMQRAQRIGSALDPVKPGAKWQAQQQHWTVKLSMRYELTEYEPGRRLVVSGLGESATVQHQFYIMPDRHDARCTSVRHISDVQLREWRSALQPMLGKLLASVPEEGLTRVQQLLNSSDSPLHSAAFDAAMRRDRAAGSSSSRRGSGASTSGSGSSWGSWAGGLFGSRDGAASSRSASGSTASTSTLDTAELPDAGPAEALDPCGYYVALELEAGVRPGQDEVKAAYRRLALQWHPDRHVAAGARAQRAAASRFDAVRAAYEVLRDEERRRLYDAGLYLGDEVGGTQ